MTEEQIQNWRKVLCGVFGLGPYALIMPREEIEKIRDRIEEKANDVFEDEKTEEKPIEPPQRKMEYRKGRWVIL